jgi:hypothetical protein
MYRDKVVLHGDLAMIQGALAYLLFDAHHDAGGWGMAVMAGINILLGISRMRDDRRARYRSTEPGREKS